MNSALVRKFSLLAVVPLVLLGVYGCEEDPTGPRLPQGVDIRPSANVFPIEIVDGDRRVTVSAVIRNQSTRIIYYGYCREGISQQVAGRWKSVWRPICTAQLVPPTPIPPGTEFNLSLQVYDQPGQPDFFPFDDIDAFYRIDVGLLVRQPVDGAEEFVLIEPSESGSAPFRVAD